MTESPFEPFARVRHPTPILGRTYTKTVKTARRNLRSRAETFRLAGVESGPPSLSPFGPTETQAQEQA